MPRNTKPTPFERRHSALTEFAETELRLDPQTEADLRELAELIIADAIAEMLESDALHVEAEVDAMFREPACPCDEGARQRCEAQRFARRFTR